jgi:hypothetical protein
VLEAFFGEIDRGAVDSLPFADFGNALGQIGDDPLAGGQSDLDRRPYFVSDPAHLPTRLVDDRWIEGLHSGTVPHMEMDAGCTRKEAGPEFGHELI